MSTVENNAANINCENLTTTGNSEDSESNLHSDKVESEDNSDETKMIEYIKNSPAVFRSQQIGDPDLTPVDKKKIAEDILHKNPVNFLIKFGEFLNEEHLDYLLQKYDSYEVAYYVKTLKSSLNDRCRKILKRNRRYEAMKKMEAEGNYFSELEMEKREPLLYHQMVGQYLSEKEKLFRNRQAHDNVIPTFSKFLMDKMDRDELDEVRKFQQKEEDGLENGESSSEDEDKDLSKIRWGESWDENPIVKKNIRKPKKKPRINISAKEKKLLLQEFKSIMQSNFINGKDSDFNYSEVDFNSEYDSIDIRSQDEEEKYFDEDEEAYDDSVCTDTGIEDY